MLGLGLGLELERVVLLLGIGLGLGRVVELIRGGVGGVGRGLGELRRLFGEVLGKIVPPRSGSVSSAGRHAA